MADGTALHLTTDALMQVTIGHDPGDASWLILPLIIRQETIGASWRDSQFTPIALAPRGPPLRCHSSS